MTDLDRRREALPLTESPLKVLCVCTGNICRSPAAEYLLRDRLGRAIDVSSAGTRALVGLPVAAPMKSLLSGLGIEPTAFRARELSPAQVRDAELVLTMTRTQRGDVVELWPKATQYAFTLKEFARLVRDVSTTSPGPEEGIANRLRKLVPKARAERRHVADPRLDEIIDPYRRNVAIYAEAFREIVEAVDEIATAAGHESQPQK